MNPVSSLWIRIAKSFIFLFLCFILVQNIQAQDESILLETIRLPQDSITINDVITVLNADYDVTLSYNSTFVDENKFVYTPKDSYDLEELVSVIFPDKKIKLVSTGRKITIVFLNSHRTISGFIRDMETGESLSGAIIYDLENDNISYSNEAGYYSLEIDHNSYDLVISLLGYESQTISVESNAHRVIELTYTNKFKPIVILQEAESEFNITDGSRLIDVTDERFNRHLVHENDLIQAVQSELTVQSGYEGQSAYIAQGAELDQNLVLVEGVPFYEFSHTLGLSSTFIKSALHSADLLTSGISSKYGDRVSSVLDVNFKKGNLYKWKKNITFGLDQAQFQIEGPLQKEKTTINAAVKQSLYNLYLPSLIDKFTDYNRNSINFSDALLNVRHKVSPTSELRAFFYFYDDEFGLGRLSSDNQITIENNTQLKWQQYTQQLNYSSVIGSDLHFNVNAALSQFNYASKSSHKFTPTDVAKSNIFNLYTQSSIRDFHFKFNLDYYANDIHKLTFGSDFNAKTISPGVLQDNQLFDGIIDTLADQRRQLPVRLISLYAQDVIIPHEQVRMYLGLRYDRFSGKGTKSVLQPRVKLVFNPAKSSRITFSYDRTAQFIHQLINNGLGLPSGFWFPSTDILTPQYAHIASAQIVQNFKNRLNVEVTGFYKSFDGLKDFNNEQQLFLPDLNSGEPPIVTEINEWENLVTQGRGWAYGGGLKLRYESEKISSMIKYFYSRSFRRFEEVNEGKIFRSTYDRPHDIMLVFNYNINSTFSVGSEWTYASGTTFSLPLEGFNNIYGIQVLTSDGKNNYRMPAYHHLNLFASYRYDSEKYRLQLMGGLTNVYNRRNAYYLYLYSLPETDKYSLRKVSLFPILPKLSISLSF